MRLLDSVTLGIGKHSCIVSVVGLWMEAVCARILLYMMLVDRETKKAHIFLMSFNAAIIYAVKVGDKKVLMFLKVDTKQKNNWPSLLTSGLMHHRVMGKDFDPLLFCS